MPWNIAGNIKGPKGDKGDPGNAADVAALIHAAISKTPADADELPLLDSTGSWGLRKFTWATLKSTLQSLFFYRGNILGTVSQSGGVPTGAIMESGVNAGGTYYRFASGLQICIATISQSGGSTTAMGSIFGGVTTSGGAFPAAFSATPTVLPGGTDNAGGGWVVMDIYPTSTTWGAYSTRNYRTAGTSGSIYLMAIGRWF